jgi:glycosyltransferase involved in cell wall biosynthesis
MTVANSNAKQRVLFIGGFGKSGDGTQGGQVFACQSLLQSPLSDRISWHLIDSTQRSEPPPGILVRFWDAGLRCLKAIWALIFKKIDTVLVFSSLLPLSIAEKGLFCILGRCLGKRAVLSIRSQPYFPRRLMRLYRWWIRLSMKACHNVVCQSQAAADLFVREFGLAADKVAIVPNWLDTGKFRPMPEQMPHGPAVNSLVYVGWLNHDKGVEHLIRSLPLVAAQRRDFRLDVFGGGELDRFLKELVVELGVGDLVMFHGWIDNSKVPVALNSGDIFVFPSLKEGMPNALLQAMACGMPVIATRISGILPLIDEGVNGLLVDPGSSGQIASAILQLLGSAPMRKAMGEKNTERILRDHSAASAWKKMERVLLPCAASSA